MKLLQAAQQAAGGLGGGWRGGGGRCIKLWGVINAKNQPHFVSVNRCGSTCDVRTSRYAPGAGFMNRRRLCQLTAAILTSDLTTHMWVL